jgi:hypothetical protein
MSKRKILTVVLLSAGCGSTAAHRPTATARVTPVPVTQLASTSGGATAAVVSTPLLSTMPAHTPPPVAEDDQQPPWRLGLRNDLYQTGPAAAGQLDRFRALCDADGYPLVGNVANKGMRYEVADLCTDVRTAALGST